MVLTILALSALHVLCCGLPLLLLTGVSLTAFLPISPMTGAIIALLLGLTGFAWHRKKSRATCRRNSGACRVGEIEARHMNRAGFAGG